jgi:hypothetical protein
MANNKKTKFSPLFPNKPPSLGDISPKSGVSESDINSLIPSLDHRYQTGDASTILFLSKRGMSRSDKLGYVLQGYSRFSTLPDLAQADLIIPLDHESDDFTKVHRTAIRGEVRPFGIFLPAGSSPYLDDPYDRADDLDAQDVYSEIIHSIRLGCSKILQAIPALIS